MVSSAYRRAPWARRFVMRQLHSAVSLFPFDATLEFSMSFKQALAAVVAGAAVLLPAAAAAQTYAFDCVSNSSPLDCAVGEAQFRVRVNTDSATQARFTFLNIGSVPSAIADIYFDDGTTRHLQSITGIINSPGVSFSQGASPPNLPGGNPIGFNTTDGLSADSDAPVVANAIDPGEQLVL